VRRRLTARIGWRPGGWLLAAKSVPSPHEDARPAGERVTLLVLHGISLPPGRFSGDHVERLFTGRLGEGPGYPELRGLRVSAHFFVRRNGRLLQFVACDRRAWHAGVSRWQGRERCNDFSIGVELEGTDRRPYTGQQYRCLAQLVSALRERYPITDIVGHCDIAPGRKTDPGPAFDWSVFGRRLAR
jgi:AmpD protein